MTETQDICGEYSPVNAWNCLQCDYPAGHSPIEKGSDATRVRYAHGNQEQGRYWGLAPLSNSPRVYDGITTAVKEFLEAPLSFQPPQGGKTAAELIADLRAREAQKRAAEQITDDAERERLNALSPAEKILAYIHHQERYGARPQDTPLGWRFGESPLAVMSITYAELKAVALEAAEEEFEDPECCVWVVTPVPGLVPHFDGTRLEHGRIIKTRGHAEHRPRTRAQYEADYQKGLR